VDPRAAFAGTFHINETFTQLQDTYAAAAAGAVPDLVPCEIYCHSLSDRSILGPALADGDAQTLTLFGLHLPARLFRADNEGRRAEALAATLRSLDSVLAEPIEDVILRGPDGQPCLEARTPVDLEQDLGLPGGNIFHRSLQWPWAETAEQVGTWGVETVHERVLVCGAGARRGGGVSGIPGANAAQAVLTGATARPATSPSGG
jgi:phytoene dehydrogenase-like protein